MTFYIIIEKDGMFEEWDRKTPVDGTLHPPDIATKWSREQIEAAGFYTIDEPRILGKIITSVSISSLDGKPSLKLETTDQIDSTDDFA